MYQSVSSALCISLYHLPDVQMVEFVGLTGPVSFDSLGKRSQFSLGVMEQRPQGQVRAETGGKDDRFQVFYF